MKPLLFVDPNGCLTEDASSSAYFSGVQAFVDRYQCVHSLTVKTSGSTGIPKEIILLKPQIAASVAQTQAAFGLTEGDILICNLSIDYIAGKLMLIRAIELNCQAVVFEPGLQAFGNLSKKTINYFAENTGKLFFAFVPLQVQAMLKSDVAVHLLNLGKGILVGGAAVSPTLRQDIQLLNVPVIATYGMTETVTHVAVQYLNGDSQSDSFTMLPEIKFQVDIDDCLAICGAVTNDQWVQTNDVVEFTTPTSFKILGRKDNVINSGGIKLHPETIEKQIQVIFQGLKISNNFFCFGEPNEKLGQQLILLIEGTPAIPYEHLLVVLREKMTRYEVPKKISFVEKFLHTVSGKLDRNKTAESYL